MESNMNKLSQFRFKAITYTCTLTLLLILMHNNTLLAQAYQGKPCKNANSKLKTELKSGSFSSYHWADLYGSVNFSSSFLKAEGKPPIISKEEKEEPETGNYRYDKWSCMYSAYQAQDGDPTTSWAEGVKGPGIGEILIVPVDNKKETRIWIGFGKNKNLYLKNSRPKKVKLYLLQPLDGDVSETGILYSSIKILGTSIVDLKDVNGWQTIQLPIGSAEKIKNERKSYLQDSRLLAVEILEVYNGTHYEDTLISEIEK